MNWSHPSSLSSALSSGVALSVPTPGVMKAVPQLDISHVLGHWHEMARLPSPSQHPGDRDIRVELEQGEPGLFRLRRTSIGPDGSERVHDTLLRRRPDVEESGQFQRTNAPSWAQWLPSAWKDLWVLATDADGRWLLLGEPRRRDLWILSREPTMERQMLEALKSIARGLGYDLAPLVVSGRLQTFQVL